VGVRVGGWVKCGFGCECYGVDGFGNWGRGGREVLCGYWIMEIYIVAEKFRSSAHCRVCQRSVCVCVCVCVCARVCCGVQINTLG